MTIALDTALIILFLAVVALGIAVLGDHVSHILNPHDTWPATKTRRKAAAKRLDQRT